MRKSSCVISKTYRKYVRRLSERRKAGIVLSKGMIWLWVKYQARMRLHRHATQIQKQWRVHSRHKCYKNQKNAAVIVQSAFRSVLGRKRSIVMRREADDLKFHRQPKTPETHALSADRSVSLLYRQMDVQLQKVRGYGIDGASSFIRHWHGVLESFRKGASKVDVSALRRMRRLVRAKIPDASDAEILCALATVTSDLRDTVLCTEGAVSRLHGEQFRNEVSALTQVIDMRALCEALHMTDHGVRTSRIVSKGGAAFYSVQRAGNTQRRRRRRVPRASGRSQTSPNRASLDERIRLAAERDMLMARREVVAINCGSPIRTSARSKPYREQPRPSELENPFLMERWKREYVHGF